MLIKKDGLEKQVIKFEKDDHLQYVHGSLDKAHHFQYLKFISAKGIQHEFGVKAKKDIVEESITIQTRGQCAWSWVFTSLNQKDKL